MRRTDRTSKGTRSESCPLPSKFPAGRIARTLFYRRLRTQFGPVVIVWQPGRGHARVRRVFLSTDAASAVECLNAAFPFAVERSCPEIRKLGRNIVRFLKGEPVSFDLGIATLGRCSDFQRRVLAAEHRIPRGRVSTYRRIAVLIGAPGAARAVGNALAHNPFPLIVPCHRAVRSDGRLGGFQGRAGMKRALLELEGVRISPDGRVLGMNPWH